MLPATANNRSCAEAPIHAWTSFRLLDEWHPLAKAALGQRGKLRMGERGNVRTGIWGVRSPKSRVQSWARRRAATVQHPTEERQFPLTLPSPPEEREIRQHSATNGGNSDSGRWEARSICQGHKTEGRNSREAVLHNSLR